MICKIKRSAVLTAGLLWALLMPCRVRAEEKFHFAPPEVYKVDSRSTLLRGGDLNGDGLTDLLTVDNNKSILEIFLQKAAGKEPRFERTERILERVAESASIADLNGDGRQDLLIGAAPPVIMYQDREGNLGPPEEIRVPGQLAAAGDLNGDGRADVVVFDKDRFSLLLQSKDGRLGQPREFANAVATDLPPELVDLDGDGRTDLLYADSQKKNEVAVRFQQEPGEFGPEQKVEVGFYRNLAALRTSQRPAASLLATVEQRTNAIKLLECGEPAARAEKYGASPPQLLALPPNANPAGLSLLLADLDGDGQDNIAVFSRELAEVGFYGWDRSGRFSLQTRPVLTDIIAAAAPAQVARPPLFVLSKKEQAIGLMQRDERGLYSIPQPLDIGAAPLAVACGDLEGDGQSDLLYCTRNTSGALEIRRWKQPETRRAKPKTRNSKPETRNSKSPSEASTLILTLGKDAKGEEPLAMQLRDLTGDKRGDLAIFFEYHPMELFLQDEKGEFRPLLTDQGVLKGLLGEARPERFWVADLDKDGRPEVLVARDRFARALRIESPGQVAVVDQFNGKNANAQINAVATGDLDGDGQEEVLLLDRANSVVTVHARERDGTFRQATNLEIPGLQLYRLLVGRLNGDNNADLLIVSDRALVVLFGGQRGARWAARWRHQTSVEDGYYALVRTADMDGDGRDELLALENSESVLEFYRVPPTGDPQLFYHFKVFDDLRPQRVRGREANLPPEPRDVWVGDLDGDKRNDLVLLVHDRVLVYRQRRNDER